MLKKEQVNAINIRNDQYFKNSEVQANKIKEWTSKNSYIKRYVYLYIFYIIDRKNLFVLF